MKKIAFIFTFLLLSIVIKAQINGKNFIDQNYIEVTGKAELEIVPDEIYLNIVINEKENKTKQSLEDLQNEMIKKLKTIGIDVDKDLAIIDFVSNFKNYLLKKNEILTSKKFQLLCHNSKTVAKVFMELEKLEISNISIERLDHSRIIDFKEEVKKEAIMAAKHKAGYLLEAIGHLPGKAIYVQEMRNVPYRSYASNSNMILRESLGYKDKAMPEPEFEKIKLEYEILVRFTIE